MAGRAWWAERSPRCRRLPHPLTCNASPGRLAPPADLQMATRRLESTWEAYHTTGRLPENQPQRSDVTAQTQDNLDSDRSLRRPRPRCPFGTAARAWRRVELSSAPSGRCESPSDPLVAVFGLRGAGARSRKRVVRAAHGWGFLDALGRQGSAGVLPVVPVGWVRAGVRRWRLPQALAALARARATSRRHSGKQHIPLAQPPDRVGERSHEDHRRSSTPAPRPTPRNSARPAQTPSIPTRA